MDKNPLDRQPPEEETAAAAPVTEARPVIDQPNLQKPLIRSVEMLVSAGMWLVFLYLLQIFVTSLAWLAGGVLLYEQTLAPTPAGRQELKTLLTAITAYAAAVFGVLWIWANWNYWRYGRLERRRPRPPVADETVAGYMEVSIDVVQQARRAKLARILPQLSGLTLEVLMEIKD